MILIVHRQWLYASLTYYINSIENQFNWESIHMQIVKNAFNKYVCIKPLIMMMIGLK